MYERTSVNRFTQSRDICLLVPSASAVSFFTFLEEGSKQLKALLHLLQEEETDRILAKADDVIVECQPRPMPEILSGDMSPTYDAAGVTKGMPEGTMRGEWRRESRPQHIIREVLLE